MCFYIYLIHRIFPTNIAQRTPNKRFSAQMASEMDAKGLQMTSKNLPKSIKQSPGSHVGCQGGAPRKSPPRTVHPGVRGQATFCPRIPTYSCYGKVGPHGLMGVDLVPYSAPGSVAHQRGGGMLHTWCAHGAHIAHTVCTWCTTACAHAAHMMHT